MRPKRITVAAATVGNWIPVDRRSYGIIGFTVNPHTSAAGTYSVNFTESAVNGNGTRVSFSRTTTVLTVTFPDHGLAVADNVILLGNSDYFGQLDVASVVDDDSFTITVADSGQTAVTGTCLPIISGDIADATAVTGKNSGTIDTSVAAIRLNCTNSTGGPHDLIFNQVEG